MNKSNVICPNSIKCYPDGYEEAIWSCHCEIHMHNHDCIGGCTQAEVGDNIDCSKPSKEILAIFVLRKLK